MAEEVAADRADVYLWLSLLEHHGAIERLGPVRHRVARILVDQSAKGRPRIRPCEVCIVREARGRWCPTCKQGMRADRSWQEHAAMLAMKAGPPLSSKDVWHIHIATGVPLYGKSERGTADEGAGGPINGLVGFLVDNGFIADGEVKVWSKRKRRYLDDGSSSPDW